MINDTRVYDKRNLPRDSRPLSFFVTLPAESFGWFRNCAKTKCQKKEIWNLSLVSQAIKSASIDLPKVMMGNYWALFSSLKSAAKLWNLFENWAFALRRGLFVIIQLCKITSKLVRVSYLSRTSACAGQFSRARARAGIDLNESRWWIVAFERHRERIWVREVYRRFYYTRYRERYSSEVRLPS